MEVGFLVLVMAGLCYSLKATFKTGKVIELHSEKAIKSFVESSEVRAIYFYTKDLKNIKFFFQDFDDAAESLDSYGISLAFCNCTEESTKDVHLCKVLGVENGIHAYRFGRERLFVQLHKLFDSNSIVANILQLSLLRDVPILQNGKAVGNFLRSLAGKKDTMFAYITAIGSLEHLVFLEMAHEYKDKLQFFISLDWAATKQFEKLGSKMKDISMVWWMWTKDKSFTSVRHKGEFSNCHLGRFVEVLLKPKMFDIPGDGLENPFSSYEVPVVRFYYDADSKAKMYQEADILTRYHGGAIWILMVNMDENEAKPVSTYKGKLPAFSFQKSTKGKEEFLPEDRVISTPAILNFLSESLGLKVEEKMEEDEDEGQEVEAAGEEEPPYTIDDVMSQDDRVADAVGKTNQFEMPLKLVPALTDKTFEQILQQSDSAVVLLYFPYDAVSLANLRMFGEAAERLGKLTTLKIGSVNCYDWTDVCQKENIIIYPTLRVYKKGEKAWDYKGPQDTMAMFATLKLLEMSPPVYEKDSDKLLQYLTGQGDSTLKGIINTTVVGLFSKGDKQEKEIFQQLAMNSRDRIMFVYTDVKETSVIADKFGSSLPTVILAKHDDTIQPYVKFSSQFTLPDLQDFVENNKLPKLTVLTPLMFPEVRKKFSQLLILFTDGSEISQHSEDTVRDIVKTQQFNNVSFNMMQVADHSSIGYRVLQQYTSEPEVPHLSLVKFQKGEVFNFAARDLNKDSVTDWLSNVVEGSVEPSTNLKDKDWKPKSKGYEFLKIIDWEAKNRKEEKPRSDVPDDVPENTEGKKHKSPGAYFDSLEDDEKAVTVEEDDDTGTRRDLFALKDSRLYHQAPGRVHHHGDRKDKGSHSVDEGYSSDEHVERDAVEESDKQHKRHDPSEL